MVTSHHVEVGLGSSVCELKTSGGSVMGRPACKAIFEDLQVQWGWRPISPRWENCKVL